MLLFVPNSAIMSEAKQRTSKVGKVFKDEAATNLAGLFVLAEKHNPNSEWAPYISSYFIRDSPPTGVN